MPEEADDRPSIIGRERTIVDLVTKKCHTAGKRLGDYTPIRETRRGSWFELRLDDEMVVRVTVEFDRVEAEP